VHTHLGPADVVGAGAAVRNRIPAVSTLHWVDNDPADRMDRLRRTAKIMARQRFVAQTIAISPVQREWYRAVGGAEGSLLVVPNGVADPGPVDPVQRARRRDSLDVGANDVLATCLAPMRRDQGHELLLDAVEQIPDSIPLIIALAGEGPLRPRLEARVAASGTLSDRVRFVHRHHDPAELLAAGDVALHTAASAALPTSLLRAMAAGRPVVATRVGGIPSLVTPATGVLVPLRAAAIADALVALAEDAERRDRLGAAARARFLTDYEAVGWARRLKDVYTSVLA
jgi:glycosyltransferase involved in cell wall biosynthesis